MVSVEQLVNLAEYKDMETIAVNVRRKTADGDPRTELEADLKQARLLAKLLDSQFEVAGVRFKPADGEIDVLLRCRVRRVSRSTELDRHDDEDRLIEARAALALMAAFGNKEYGVVKAPDQPVPIPLRKTLNLIFADVRINGKGPYNFVIDTGASQTALSEKLARDLGLKVITSTVLHGVGGSGKANSNIYRIDQLQIGDVSVGDLPVGTFDDPIISQLADGIIGTAMLADFIITINYPQGLLELSHKPVTAPDAIAIWCVSNMLLLPADANGKPGNFIVDTGAITSVLSLSMANAMGVNEKTPGALVDLGIAGVGGAQGVTLMLPPVTLKSARQSEALSQALAIDLKEVSRMLGTEVSGVAGFDFLSKYKLTIDYYKAEIHLSK